MSRPAWVLQPYGVASLQSAAAGKDLQGGARGSLAQCRGCSHTRRCHPLFTDQLLSQGMSGAAGLVAHGSTPGGRGCSLRHTGMVVVCSLLSRFFAVSINLVQPLERRWVKIALARCAPSILPLRKVLGHE